MTPTNTERPACECGCGGFPKGKRSRFVPGHDAKLHSAQKKAEAEAPRAPVNDQDAAPKPSRRRSGHGDTTKSAGSKA